MLYSEPKGLVFHSWEQWNQIQVKIADGLIPCPLCGQLRNRLWKIPTRYKKLIKATEHCKLMPINFRGCAYCISELATERKLRDLMMCHRCGNLYPRKDTSGLRNILRRVGCGHHVWVNKAREVFLKDVSIPQGIFEPDRVIVSLARICKYCAVDIIEYILEYKIHRDAKRAFEASRQAAIRREKEQEDSCRALNFSEWQEARFFFNEKCAYCGNAHQAKDHIFPVSKGGKFIQGNIVPVCTRCNSRKSNNNPILWFRKQGKAERFSKLLLWITLHNLMPLLG